MIGYDPIVETMIVVTGQDLSHHFGVSEPFPNGTTVVLKIFDRDGDQVAAYPAVGVSATGALVQIASTDADAIPDASSFRVFVTYPDGQDFCWYRGRVWRR